jgi:hypothetical protein
LRSIVFCIPYAISGDFLAGFAAGANCEQEAENNGLADCNEASDNETAGGAT